MKKSVDSTFLHYGVRQEDLQVIVQACQDSDIDAEWMKESILKPYHEERNNQNYVDDKRVNKILKKALKDILLQEKTVVIWRIDKIFVHLRQIKIETIMAK